MAKNSNDLPNPVSSDRNNEMTDSNLEDDAEDYIQPSQPLSFQSHGVVSVGTRMPTDSYMGEKNISTIDETLPYPKLMISTPFCDVSHDFIPESENPVKRKMENLDNEEACKKKLNLDLSSMIKETPDMFSTQSQLMDTIDATHLKGGPSPSGADLGSLSMIPESPSTTKEIVESEQSYTMFSESNKHAVLEETVAENSYIDVASYDADSYAPENSKNELSDTREDGRVDSGGDEIDSSKFVDDSRMTSLLSLDNPPPVDENKKFSQETQLDDTIDAEDINCYTPYSSERKDQVETVSRESVPPESDGLITPSEKTSESTSTSVDLKPEISRLKSVLKNISDEELARLQKHSTPENPLSKSPKINESASSIENGTPPVDDNMTKCSEINFSVYLQLDCQLVMDPQKNEPISKKIVQVKELVKRQPKHLLLDPNSDSSYKTKILSSSSLGSVYSDKTGLPYALPNRSLPLSINSSSSSVDLAKHVQIIGRQVWINEYKIPMAIDEIMPRYIEIHKLGLPTTSGKPSAKRKLSIRLRKKSHWSHPLDNVLESSTTEEHSSGNNSDERMPELNKDETPKLSSPTDVKKCTDEDDTIGEEKENKEEISTQMQNVQRESYLSSGENECSGSILSEGVLVFARWTDKRYYPGVLRCKAKYDRWEVKFDDDTEKVIREDLILPLNWLTKGELVFAMTADKYMSGKIADIIREEEIIFKIELDDTNEEVVVKKCDICLNDVMAGIIREKFKPTNKAIPALKSCDIDVDNVLIGKRVREQRTPIRGMASALQNEGSTAKKRRGGLRLNENLGDDKETPVKMQTPLRKSDKKSRCSSRKKGAKAISGDEAEVAPTRIEKTPVQSEPKSDGKKKPRALKYECDETESSGKNLRKSEKLENEKGGNPAPAQTESAIKDRRAKEQSKPKKSGKMQKAKTEKGGGGKGRRKGKLETKQERRTKDKMTKAQVKKRNRNA